MTKLTILLTVSFSLSQCIAQETTLGPVCDNERGSGRTVRLSVNSKRNLKGDWVDSFTALTEHSNSSESVDLDVTHRVAECEGKRSIYIQGVARDKSNIHSHERILFHPKCGKNVAIVNHGRTVQKIKLEEPLNSVALTDRPLKNNEIFEVRLDSKSTKFSTSLGIGISIHSPSEIDIPAQMYKTYGSWMMHHTNIYSNGSEIITNYGRNLNELKVGDRVGAMRSEFGTLHIFVNGIDQGPVASNVPYPVYGVVELYYNAAKATIVDKYSASSP